MKIRTEAVTDTDVRKLSGMCLWISLSSRTDVLFARSKTIEPTGAEPLNNVVRRIKKQEWAMRFAQLNLIGRIIGFTDCSPNIQKSQQRLVIDSANGANVSPLDFVSRQGRMESASKSPFAAEVVRIDSALDILYALTKILHQALQRSISAYLKNDFHVASEAISSGSRSEKRIIPDLLDIREFAKENEIDISSFPLGCNYADHLGTWVPCDQVEYFRYMFKRNVLNPADAGAISAKSRKFAAVKKHIVRTRH